MCVCVFGYASRARSVCVSAVCVRALRVGVRWLCACLWMRVRLRNGVGRRATNAGLARTEVRAYLEWVRLKLAGGLGTELPHLYVCASVHACVRTCACALCACAQECASLGASMPACLHVCDGKEDRSGGSGRIRQGVGWCDLCEDSLDRRVAEIVLRLDRLAHCARAICNVAT